MTDMWQKRDRRKERGETQSPAAYACSPHPWERKT